jgi:hypothetical protein
MRITLRHLEQQRNLIRRMLRDKETSASFRALLRKLLVDVNKRNRGMKESAISS